MSLIFETNADTGMSTLKFDSSGRTVQFSPVESENFRNFLLGIKMQGKMAKESIGSKAVYALQQLGLAIEEGDPQTIADIWLGNGSKIVDNAILNNIIGIELEIEKVDIENTFHLFMTDYKRDTALAITNTVKFIIDELAQNIIDLEVTSEYCDLMPTAVDRIKCFYPTKVGLSDTASREAMGVYLQSKLVKVFDAVDHIPMMQDFMNHL